MYVFFTICALFFTKDVLPQAYGCYPGFEDVVNSRALTEDCEAENQYPWSYHGTTNGPSHWHEDYPKCGGKNQSPIEISKDDIENLKFDKLVYYGFDKPVAKASVTNIGWTVIVIPEDGVIRSIQWSSYNYTLDEIHFHFGTASDPGADHVLFGTRYEMEIHYVLNEEGRPGDVAVVAALMQGTSDNNSAFDPITEVLPAVKYRNDSSELQSELNLESLLPQNDGSYYLYFGSNSIPPCQFQPWVILQSIGTVGNDQICDFMALSSVGEEDSSASCPMGPNYRPLQDLGLRPVFASK